MENGLSIQNRNRTMTGVRFLLRVTMRRHDLAAEVFHMKEPRKIPLILSAVEAKRLLTMAGKLQVRVLLSIGYGAGLRVSEVVKLEGEAHRQRARHHSRRAGQGQEGSQCDALAGDARTVARMVEGSHEEVRCRRTRLGSAGCFQAGARGSL